MAAVDTLGSAAVDALGSAAAPARVASSVDRPWKALGLRAIELSMKLFLLAASLSLVFPMALRMAIVTAAKSVSYFASYLLFHHCP